MSAESKSAEKQIFVLRGPGSCGKSSTLAEVFNILNEKYPIGRRKIILPERDRDTTDGKIEIKFKIDYYTRDIRVTIEIGGNSIGIESCGDPSGIHRLRVGLEYFKTVNCNIIFCSARPNDNDTHDLINSYSKNVKFIEKTKEYNKQLHSKSNLEVAEQLIKLAGL